MHIADNNHMDVGSKNMMQMQMQMSKSDICILRMRLRILMQIKS